MTRPPPQKPLPTTALPDKKKGAVLEPVPGVPAPGKA
jgi:hypothetical protein